MRTLAWRTASAGIAVGLFALAFGGPALSQQVVPDDETPIIDMTPPDPDRPEATGAIQDKPTSRLQWQRKAWGVVTPDLPGKRVEGRQNPRRQEECKGPKWVSIGPTGAQYQQNGSFTGLVRDSGRARTILPHPIEPRYRLYADLRRRPVAHEQLDVEQHRSGRL